MALRRHELTVLVLAAVLHGCGGGGGGADTTPNAFSFVDQADVALSSVITSAPVTISGINAAAAISVTGGMYSIGCGAAYTSSTGTINNNQTVCVRHTSAASPGAATSTRLTVGGVGATFTSTTTAGPATFSVSGTINATAGSFTDGDVNDPSAPYMPNDDPATAQAIDNPATVGGYVNQPGSGEAGRLQAAGDTDDIYRVALAAGQVLTLTIADSVAGDLDLYLLDNGNNLVASAEGTNVTEAITVTASGTYLIDVHAHDGASNYVLTIGQSINPGINATSAHGLSVLADFVPGELLARFDPVKSQGQSVAARLAGMDMRVAAAEAVVTEGPVLIKLDDAKRQLASATPEGADPMERPPQALSGNADLQHKWRTLRAIKKLRRQPGVRYAEPNYRRKAAAVPNDELYPLQWHYPLIHLPQAWDITTGSSAVIVAVIDSGVLLSHPDLQGQLISGYDFISDPTSALDGDGRDPDPDDPGDLLLGDSSSFHGTHVAGTIAAATNNGIGVAGVAWRTRILPLRVLGSGGNGTISDINQAVLYAARLPNASGTLPAKRADIINMSFGGPDFSQAGQDVITQARNQGIIIIASAGNEAENGNPVGYPASFSGVVSVGAVAMDKTRAPYSGFNALVDVAAPGGDGTLDQNGDGYGDGVLSTAGNDSSGTVSFGFRFAQGTSMAAPHVAGVVALMKAVNPALTPAQFDALLASGRLTQDLGPPGRDDEFGYGLVDAYAAVVSAQTTPTPLPARLVATPSALNFGTQGINATLSLVNGGGGSLGIQSVSDNAAWLTMGAASNPITGLGSRIVSVNRAGLAVGTYTASITLVSTTNTVVIPVIMQVSPGTTAANAGFLYVLLVDPETNESTYHTQLNVVDGVYRYNIPDVAAGSYILMAGSNYNNDTYICDPGEACGIYPTLDSYSLLQVSSNRTDVNFSVGHNPVIRPQAGGAMSSSGIARFSGRRAGR